jgi:1,4-alpha-glucan branching enzyme
MQLLPENCSHWELHAVHLKYFDPQAKEVCLAGAFNNWRPEGNPMRQEVAGQWTTELLLRPGEYEYRLLVDGQWKDDPMAKRYVSNPFGGFNCVLEVKPFPATLPIAPPLGANPLRRDDSRVQ